jgi:lysophospholipase L1-like esterase
MRRFLFGLLVFCSLTAAAQETSVKWWNPKESSFPTVEGQAWPNEVKNPYDRLPARAEVQVRKPVWGLSNHSAGLMIRFRTNAPSIQVRYITGKNIAMPHMPATGVSGVDLYSITSDGTPRWCSGQYAFKDTVSYTFAVDPNDGYHKLGREYRLYLPLYNAVEWLEIGVPNDAVFSPLPVRTEKPIVVYGTSIAQGGCASRPGMAWTAILQRYMDRPMINLGFSGNGRLETELIDMIGEIDSKVIILDCLPNLIKNPDLTMEELKSRIIKSVRSLRNARSQTPIVLAEHAGYSSEYIHKQKKSMYQEVNDVLRQAFAQLTSEGITGISLISKEEFNLGQDGTVDGTHPNDVGMQRYAEGYEKHLRKILYEPTNTASTTIPCTQLREPGSYDWDARHLEQLRLNKVQPPQKVLFGNSITHYWGGNPQEGGSKGRGEDSWNAVFSPLGVRNMGNGWDRIENVIWRVFHDELDGISPNQILVMIGTNNLQINSDAEILAGWDMLIDAIKVRQPKARLTMVGILPRTDFEPRIAKLNSSLAALCKKKNVEYKDAGKGLLLPSGKINTQLFLDGLHPNATGYKKLSEAFKPILSSN